MVMLRAGVWLLASWLAAGIDARTIEASLWLARCAQADPASKLVSVYSVSHGLAFPCSFSLMILMSVWHMARPSLHRLRPGPVVGTGLMWLSMYPACLVSEQVAQQIAAPVDVQVYAFLMLAVSSAITQIFNDKNLFPERGCR